VAKRRKDEMIERLSHESVETMERVLENASKLEVPIELDGIVYFIPKPISDLIDALANQAGIDNPEFEKNGKEGN